MLILEALLIATVLIACVTDLLENRIHNALTMPMFLIGVIARGRLAETVWWEGLAAAALVGVPYFLLYALGKMGPGDVKLMAALAALGGLQFAVLAGIGSLLVGGLFALVALILAGRLGDVVQVFMRGAKREKSLMAPHGVAIGVASLAVLVLQQMR